MIETCVGLRNAYDLIAASPRGRGVALAGAEEGDFIVDLGGGWDPTGEAVLYPPRQPGSHAPAARGPGANDGGVINLADDRARRRDTPPPRHNRATAKA